MTEKEKEVSTLLMLQGFENAISEAVTKVTGGQTVQNPWPMLGGTAIAVSDNFHIPINAKPGNIIILTKPIGTQPVINAY